MPKQRHVRVRLGVVCRRLLAAPRGRTPQRVVPDGVQRAWHLLAGRSLPLRPRYRNCSPSTLDRSCWRRRPRHANDYSRQVESVPWPAGTRLTPAWLVGLRDRLRGGWLRARERRGVLCAQLLFGRRALPQRHAHLRLPGRGGVGLRGQLQRARRVQRPAGQRYLPLRLRIRRAGLPRYAA